MKFLVVGAGGQGAPCASMLFKDPEVSEIVLADIDLELAERISKKIGSDRITTMRVDACICFRGWNILLMLKQFFKTLKTPFLDPCMPWKFLGKLYEEASS